MRREFAIGSITLTILLGLGAVAYPQLGWLLVIIAPILILGWYDFFQAHSTIRRNFPIAGRFRYLFEAIRPEINQYFIESNTDGVPLSREQRSIVYQRAKRVLDTLPFGTQHDVYAPGYEWLNHSLAPKHVDPKELRVTIGSSACRAPYSASILNVSAMSFGSLSKNAVLALNGGARDGNFAHNTGEGGLTPYHLEPGGDLIWQIGTAYFGCRTGDGGFDPEQFRDKAALPQVRMIELKLSQGAKPSHGGILPAGKVTKEISKIRGVPMGRDVISPPGHSTFSTPVQMMEFIATLRDLSGGKPVGFKLCLGKRREFLAICKAMLETEILPDFITVDGGEGGTGAAPLEFSNHVGTPGSEGLLVVHNALTGCELRDKLRVITTGKVNSGFEIIKRLALGADLIYSARAMMLALGCIQALRCNANTCPTGVATQDPNLVAGLVVKQKRVRVRQFHEETLKSTAELLGAMGLGSTHALKPWHVLRRVNRFEVRHYGELTEMLEPGSLRRHPLPSGWERAWHAATAKSFRNAGALLADG